MHLPVAVWSHVALEDLQLEVVAICVHECDDGATLVCGTASGALLLFRLRQTWELAALLLRHRSPITGLVTGTNEWGEEICVSVDSDGAVATWLLADGRCLEFQADAGTEIAPILGMQMLCNDRYVLLYGEQGRMIMFDAWKATVLASPGTGMDQGRIDVSVSASKKATSTAYDAHVLSLGMEGLCMCYGWTQPIMTTATATSTDRVPSYVWKAEWAWILSWAAGAADITCIEAQIQPATNWLDGDTFPLLVRSSPSGQLLLFVWPSRFAVLKRCWLFGAADDNLASRPTTAQGAAASWTGGAFCGNDDVVLWDEAGGVYTFPAATETTGPALTTLYLFTQPSADAEKPASMALPLHAVSVASPVVVVPHCGCRRPPFAAGFGVTTCSGASATTLRVTAVCPRGCTWHWAAPVASLLQPVAFSDQRPRDAAAKTPRVSHIVGGKKAPAGAVAVRGYDDGHLSVVPLVEAWAAPVAVDCLSSGITCVEHLLVNGMEPLGTLTAPCSGPVYEGYADSPTSSVRYPSTQKLQRISLLLHKLQHHQPTPKAASPPMHFAPLPDTAAWQESQVVFLLFTGSRDGGVGVSQLSLRLDDGTNAVVPSVTRLHTFHRHTQAISGIRASGSSSQFGYLVACISDDRSVSIYAVRLEHAALDVAFYMACPGHGGPIRDVRWDLRTHHAVVECANDFTYFWSLKTGVLERIVPAAMVPAPSRATDRLGLGSFAIAAQLPHVHVVSYELRSTVERLQRLWTASPAASSGAIDATLLSFALTWHLDPQIDALVQRLLHVHPPALAYSIAIAGPTGALTVPVPANASHGAKWEYSAVVSATLSLALVTLCTSFMDDKRKDDEDSEQLQVCLPERLPAFHEPALEVLAAYGFHEWEALQMASRLLLHGVIKRLPPALRTTTAAEYMTRYHCEAQALEKEAGSLKLVPAATVVARLGPLLVVLSILGTCYPGELSPPSARQVCDVLVALLAGPCATACVAAELLAKGLLLFRPHLEDLAQLVVQLIPLTLEPADDDHRRLKQAAMRLLVELGTCEAASVLTVLQHEMSASDRSYAYREGVLVYLMTWVNMQFLLMARHLPAVVETILCCLDPTKPDRRRKCLAMSTKCLHDLVKRFPMVDFHKATQRLAVGTMEGAVLLFDLRTATKWRVLEGHTTGLSAVLFRKDGAMLISYAAREGAIRWWNIAAGGLLSLLKVQQSCVRQLQLAPLMQHLQRPAELHKVIQTCRFRSTADDGTSNVWLTREDESVLPLNFHI
ncbi:hypothetical protein ACHHYP_03177 [Achlya hypogyna]|uniref:Uncharacterized protein n=1 Tax=Achlya hypogyna TaxID=1202772 RepID=A0A1V9Z4G5_ACHHY|nr:hypothetical protein ACHHYP_03177 [Achlya hypogyna]